MHTHTHPDVPPYRIKQAYLDLPCRSFTVLSLHLHRARPGNEAQNRCYVVSTTRLSMRLEEYATLTDKARRDTQTETGRQAYT
eukprot:42968-Eustigmatos_ZCMA.PRE.1